jgi:hypothetical protein
MSIPEEVLCDCMMVMSFGQFATYEVLGCGFGEVLPTEMAGVCFTTEQKWKA